MKTLAALILILSIVATVTSADNIATGQFKTWKPSPAQQFDAAVVHAMKLSMPQRYGELSCDCRWEEPCASPGATEAYLGTCDTEGCCSQWKLDAEEACTDNWIDCIFNEGSICECNEALDCCERCVNDMYRYCLESIE
jgi:hypothetical protein